MSTDENNGAAGFQDLLKYNYDNLHKSVWEAYKFFWLMTSIFVPIIFAAFGFFIKEFEHLDIIETAFGAFIIISITWFWYKILDIMDGYNKTRFEKLERIEEVFNEYYLSSLDQASLEKILIETKFEQYSLEYPGKFNEAARRLRTLLIILSIAFIVVKAVGTIIYWTA